MSLTDTKAHENAGLNVHSFARWGSAIGISVLCLRRFLYLKYPGFLPSENWNPSSTTTQWASTIFNTTALFIMLLVLPGVPLCLYLAVRTRKAQSGNIPLAVDATAFVALYAATYFLLFPPR